MQDLVNRRKKGDLIIYVSDNERWFTTKRKCHWGANRATENAKAWADFKAYNPKAKMVVCIDLQPGTTTHVQSDTRVLNVGGFSDVIANFASQSADKDFLG